MTRKTLLTGALALSIAGPVAASLSFILPGEDRLWPLSWLAWAPVGYVILLKKPRNGVGRVLLFIGLTMGISFATLASVAWVPASLAPWMELVNVAFGVLPWLGIVWLILVFPTGELAGTAERVVGIPGMAYGGLAMFAFTVSPELMEETGVPSPLAVPALEDIASIVTGERGFLPVLVFLIASLILMVRRWRRGSGVERAQFRWLFFGASLFAFVLTVGQFLPDDSSFLLLWLPSGFAIPVSIGIAITRFRLFEIDRILSRTLTYALLVGLLGASFFLVVTFFTRFLPSDDPVVVATATLVGAALFNPARRRIQEAVDRRFNRSRYDAELLIEGFANSLQSDPDADHVGDGLILVVNETMEPRASGLWVRL